MEPWAEDEARLGRKPILRRVWAWRGRRPTANGRMRFDWLDVFGFVHPATGRNLELIAPKVNTAWMSAAPEEFVRWADPDSSKTIVLLVDDAGWHIVTELEVSPGLVLHPLPPCTPGLQPVESSWPLARGVVADKGFATLDHMEPVLVDWCRWWIDHPETVKGSVGFGWAVAIDGQ